MKRFLVIALVGCLNLAGCAQKAPEAGDANGEKLPSVDGSKFLLAEEPAGAKDVIKVRQEAKDGEEVVLVGRIGGSADPWNEGRAAFSIVDNSLKACSDIPGDLCTKPWDYCCETDKLPTATALIKVVDDHGTLVKADAKQLLDVEELSTVVIKGRAKRDDAGNLTVLTSSVFVKKK